MNQSVSTQGVRHRASREPGNASADPAIGESPDPWHPSRKPHAVTDHKPAPVLGRLHETEGLDWIVLAIAIEEQDPVGTPFHGTGPSRCHGRSLSLGFPVAEDFGPRNASLGGSLICRAIINHDHRADPPSEARDNLGYRRGLVEAGHHRNCAGHNPRHA